MGAGKDIRMFVRGGRVTPSQNLNPCGEGAFTVSLPMTASDSR